MIEPHHHPDVERLLESWRSSLPRTQARVTPGDLQRLVSLLIDALEDLLSDSSPRQEARRWSRPHT